MLNKPAVAFSKEHYLGERSCSDIICYSKFFWEKLRNKAQKNSYNMLHDLILEDYPLSTGLVIIAFHLENISMIPFFSKVVIKYSDIKSHFIKNIVPI